MVTDSLTPLAQIGWVVVARHRRAFLPDGPMPWGTVHVKRIGEARTACGKPAIGWHAFWQLHLLHDADPPCHDCGNVLRNAIPSS